MHQLHPYYADIIPVRCESINTRFISSVKTLGVSNKKPGPLSKSRIVWLRVQWALNYLPSVGFITPNSVLSFRTFFTAVIEAAVSNMVWQCHFPHGPHRPPKLFHDPILAKKNDLVADLQFAMSLYFFMLLIIRGCGGQVKQERGLASSRAKQLR